MTLIIISNSILALAVVSAIVGGHLWAIVSSSPVTAPEPAPVTVDAELADTVGALMA